MASIIQKKRLANEVKLLTTQPLHYCTAYPDESNQLIWYFMIKGQKKTDYHTEEEGGGGEYIGKIVHSPKYPAEPPDYYMLTPSGRYNIGSKICLTNSSYHKGDWSSTWNILSILIAFYSIWLDDKEHGISHITDTPSNRKKMASESIAYNLKNNKAIYEKFDRTYLRDDDPVILKKKVVCNEKQTEQTEQAEKADQTEKAGQTEQINLNIIEANNVAHIVEQKIEMIKMKEMILIKEPIVMKEPMQINKNIIFENNEKVEPLKKEKKVKKTTKKVEK